MNKMIKKNQKANQKSGNNKLTIQVREQHKRSLTAAARTEVE
jgi:hypothetical protein